jgi:hypothetical protein
MNANADIRDFLIVLRIQRWMTVLRHPRVAGEEERPAAYPKVSRPQYESRPERAVGF